MAFMERQITRKCSWYRVETSQGTEFVDADLVGKQEPADSDGLKDYCEGIPVSWELIKGHGARLSAPGYLDCTEWAVFDTAEEAQKYLEENYPDEDEEA